jgi:hypothetical protein
MKPSVFLGFALDRRAVREVELVLHCVAVFGTAAGRAIGDDAIAGCPYLRRRLSFSDGKYG